MLYCFLLLFSFISSFARADSIAFRLVTSFVDDALALDPINYLLYNPSESDTVGVYTDEKAAFNFQGVITETGFFKLTAGGYVTNDTYLYIDETNGSVFVSNSSKSGPFELDDEVLYYKGSASFYLNEIVASEGYDLYWGTNDNSLKKSYTLLLKASTASGGSDNDDDDDDDDDLEDFSPKSASTTYSLTTTTSAVASSTSSSSTGGVASTKRSSNIMIFVATLFSLFI